MRVRILAFAMAALGLAVCSAHAAPPAASPNAVKKAPIMKGVTLPPSAQPKGLLVASLPAEPMAVGNFRVTRQECRQDFSGATLTISAEIVAPAGPPDQTGEISVEIAGVRQAAQSARAQNGKFSVTRQINVTGASGKTVLRFVHDGKLRTSPLTAQHSCISLTPIRNQPGVLTLPDLGFVGPIIVDYLANDREGIFLTPDDGNPFTESRVYRLDGLTPWAVRANLDTAGRLPLYRLQAGCPRAGEAFMTISVFVGVKLIRFAEIENYSPGISRYYDARGTSGVATWSVSSGPTPGRAALPGGMEWARYNLVLPCTREGQVELLLDPENRVLESDEGNNRVRFLYDLIGQ